MTNSKRFAFAAALCVLAFGGQAHAEPDEQRALTLFDRGRKLARDGRCAEAIAPLLESIHYVEGVGPLLNLGACYEAIGKTASAYRYFLRAQEVAVQRDDRRREEAGQRAHAIEKDLSTLLVRIPPVLKTAEVRVDGDIWSRDRWNTAWPIDPGSHEVEVNAPPHPKQSETITVRPKGDHMEWNAPISIDDEAKPPEEKATSKAEPEPSSSSTQRTLGYVSGGAGVVGLIAGSIFGFVSISNHSSATGRCPTYPRCDAADRVYLDDVNSRAESAGTVSTIAFALGAALIATGLVLVFTAPQPATRSTATR